MKEEELRKIYRNKANTNDGFSEVSFNEFNHWYDEDTFNNGCHYCGITNEESLELYNLRPEATRGGKRGKRLELGRKDSNLPFDNLDNLVWCCYWCNNAKTNFFSEEEFRPIGEAIGGVLRGILQSQD